MTLEDAKIHIQYIQTVKPDVFNDLGITDNIDDSIIEEAAEIATQTHWGAPEISVELLFNKTLKKLIESQDDINRG